MKLILLAVVLGAFAIMFIIGAIIALFNRRIFKACSNLFTGICIMALAGTLGLGIFAVNGYKTFNYEMLAATVTVQPVSDGKFYAHFHFIDGTDKSYLISGEQLYVDAHILKWQPIANFFGIHTSYLLSRVAGRYMDVEDESTKSHTVYALHEENKLDMFNLRKKYSKLSMLVDAEYGSASFVPAEADKKYALMVSSSGLLFRKM